METSQKSVLTASTDLMGVPFLADSVVGAGSIVDDGRQVPAWRAPPDAQTSGSVVRNSMTLLPADGNLVRNEADDSPDSKSRIPAALAVDGSAESDNRVVENTRGEGPTREGLLEDKGPITRDNLVVAPAAKKEFEDTSTTRATPVEHAVVENTVEDSRDNAEANCKLAVVDGRGTGGGNVDVIVPPELPRLILIEAPRDDKSKLPKFGSVAERDPALLVEETVATGNDLIPVVHDKSTNITTGTTLRDVPSPVPSPTAGDTGSIYMKDAVAGTVGGVDQMPAEDDVAKREDVGLIETACVLDDASRTAVSVVASDTNESMSKPTESLGEQATKERGAIHRKQKQNEADSLLPLSDRDVTDCEANHAETTVSGEPVQANEEVRQKVFLPSNTFTGVQEGYIFKLGDRGLGFYVDGHVDNVKKQACMPARRPWNAGPGDDAIRRGAIGPISRPFKKVTTLRKRKEEAKKNAEDSDTRPFMARMVAQRNSRGFQSTLLNREHVLDAHILSLLEKFNDPSFFKKKHGYNVHGQMLGKDGKMIVKPPVEKTEEEKAKLSWYRKVYEDRLGKHLPSKRLGDSIEARREAYAYSRCFTDELDVRQIQLNKSLQTALKGVTKLEFVTEDYHYPGAYDIDGKVILEKGTPPSNELHQTEEQKERACSFRFKAIQRYRAAHDDIVNAIFKKDKALQKLFKKSDPVILQEIAQEAVESSGMGLYRQRKREGGIGSGPEAGGSDLKAIGPIESSEQMRDTFAQTLKSQIKNRDKTLMKEVAALDDKDANQMIDDFGKGVEINPDSWRRDPVNLRRMQRRRKELISEIEADSRKVVCPWRPGGLHIAHEEWKPFLPRDRRPPVRSASEGQTGSGVGVSQAQVTGARLAGEASSTSVAPVGAAGRSDGKVLAGGPQRPHTAPTPRRKDFMGRISVRARRILATQQPGTPLHNAFSTYSNDPYPLEVTQGSRAGLDLSVKGRAAGDFSPPTRPRDSCWTNIGEGRKRAWTELSGSMSTANSTHIPPMCGRKGHSRPRSALPEAPRQASAPKRRPSTACGTRDPRNENVDEIAPTQARVVEDLSSCVTRASTNAVNVKEQDETAKPLDLRVQGGAGVTVLWARLCKPSDTVHEKATWPSGARTSAVRPHRRRGRQPRKTWVVADADSQVPLDRRGQDLKTTNGGRPAIDARSEGRVGVNSEVEANGDGALRAPLDVLEEGLSASSWRRLDQRKRVFRGYSDRSRRERTWDPGSAFYAEGATRHCEPGRRRIIHSKRGGQDRCLAGLGVRGGGVHELDQAKRHRRRRTSTDMEEPEEPVNMDWKEVDTNRFSCAAEEMRIKLEGKLFTVVAEDEGDVELEECFREAWELLNAAGDLLGWPHILRERFSRKFGGDCRIGNYVSTVSRLSLMWTATSGVVDILGMMRRREALLKEWWEMLPRDIPNARWFSAEERTTTETGGGRDTAISDTSVSVDGLCRQDRIRAFEKRLDIAEYSIAVAESSKLWAACVPWRVRVLWEDDDLLSWLGTEERAIPWPPESVPDSDNVLHLGADGAAATDETAIDGSVLFGRHPLEAQTIVSAVSDGESFAVDGDQQISFGGNNSNPVVDERASGADLQKVVVGSTKTVLDETPTGL